VHFTLRLPHRPYNCLYMERRAERTQAKAYATLILLACCPCASALNPSLDINQYAHTAWTIRDGLFKGIVTSTARRPTVISGSARSSACSASTAFGASHGSRRRVSISLAAIFEDCSFRGMGVFGSGPIKA